MRTALSIYVQIGSEVNIRCCPKLPDVELRAGCVYFPGIIDSRISFTTCDNRKISSLPSDIEISLINVSDTHRVAITIKGILYSYALEDAISISCTSASLEEHDRQ